MLLAGLNEEVQEVFDMAGFSSLFEIHPTITEAKHLQASDCIHDRWCTDTTRQPCAESDGMPYKFALL